MIGVCMGYRADGPPVDRLRSGQELGQALVDAPGLEAPNDPQAWHVIPGPPAGSAMLRRRRRLDVTESEGCIEVEPFFRDCLWQPDGTERVVHGYLVHAEIDRTSMRLTAVTARPLVLPFVTCPPAAANVDLLVGQPVHDLRSSVLEVLPGTAGCTHLNDALRGLADVPALVAQLPRR